MTHPCLCDVCLKARDDELRRAREAERERCAKRVETVTLESGRGHVRKTRLSYQTIKFQIADAIRALR